MRYNKTAGVFEVSIKNVESESALRFFAAEKFFYLFTCVIACKHLLCESTSGNWQYEFKRGELLLQDIGAV